MAGAGRDVRKVFIFTTTQNYFGLASEPCDPPLACSGPEINNFLDDGNQMLLRAQRSDAGVSFSNAVRPPRSAPPGAGPAHVPSGTAPPPRSGSLPRNPRGLPPKRALLSP